MVKQILGIHLVLRAIAPEWVMPAFDTKREKADRFKQQNRAADERKSLI